MTTTRTIDKILANTEPIMRRWRQEQIEYNEEVHKHKWKENYLEIRHVSSLQIKCVGCGEIMDHEEIARRLNATEYLSAEIAEAAADHCGDLIESYDPECSALREYANERTGSTSS